MRVWGLPDLDGRVQLQGIAFPAPHGWTRCWVTLTYKRSPKPIRSWGGSPYRRVLYGTDPMRIWGPHKNSWIRIQESGSRCIHIQFGMIRGSGPRPDPESFAFSVLMNFFLRIRTQGSGSGFTSHPTVLEKFSTWFVKENSDPRLPLSGSVHVLQFSLRCGTWFEDWDVHPRTGTVVRCDTTRQWTTDQASASGSAFRTARYASAF
jgi:hypothetical protein